MYVGSSGSPVHQVYFTAEKCHENVGFGFTLPSFNASERETPPVIANASLLVNVTSVGAFGNATFAISRDCGPTLFNEKCYYRGEIPAVGTLFTIEGQCVSFELDQNGPDDCAESTQKLTLDVGLIGDFCKTAPASTRECKDYDPTVTSPPEVLSNTTNDTAGGGTEVNKTKADNSNASGSTRRRVLLSILISSFTMILSSQ